jgi:hypothetical protein
MHLRRLAGGIADIGQARTNRGRFIITHQARLVGRCISRYTP